jgi:hypothetical protein
MPRGDTTGLIGASAEVETGMQVESLVLPVFAIIVTGWLAGWLG